MSVEIAWKQNILVTDFHLLKSLLVVFGFGSQAFICGFSRQNINSAWQKNKIQNRSLRVTSLEQLSLEKSNAINVFMPYKVFEKKLRKWKILTYSTKFLLPGLPKRPISGIYRNFTSSAHLLFLVSPPWVDLKKKSLFTIFFGRKRWFHILIPF